MQAAAVAFRRVGVARPFRPAQARLFSYSQHKVGEQGTLDYRMHFQDKNGNKISPWHDIPLKSGEHFNCLIEIPKMTKPKMEVAVKEEMNPIAQDVKKGKLRDYHGPIFWNYGMLPQTWEDPNVTHKETNCAGDNDPVDVVEIGSEALPQGAVEPVKVLGVLAMIDDGELDWKVIGIRVADKLASELNDIDDVEAKCPGVISGIREWFRWYKTPDGKPLNAFGFEEWEMLLNHGDPRSEQEQWHDIGSESRRKPWTRSLPWRSLRRPMTRGRS
ncbi:unnamed protein product [Effrenium voratum]|nr:unnamed protein product [Effrenium voratum]